jgi:hypothetical protein
VQHRREVRDNDLLDRLDVLPRHLRSLKTWRLVRDGRDPCQCSASGGRWDDGSFDVLYTSLSPDGATAELYFHLAKGQPVFPSKVRYRLFELHVELRFCFEFDTLESIAALGVDVSAYGQLAYTEREREYPRLQEVGEHAHFLGADGLCVTSARWNVSNCIIFCDQVPPDSLTVDNDLGIVDWDDWIAKNRATIASIRG